MKGGNTTDFDREVAILPYSLCKAEAETGRKGKGRHKQAYQKRETKERLAVSADKKQ